LRESRNRIGSMAMIHEQLDQSESMAHIDLETYVKRLAGTLMQSYTAFNTGVNMDIDLSGIVISANRAVPWGLAVNELLSNALKYAFPDGREGRIVVEGRCGEDGSVTVTIRDDGVGLPQDLDWRRPTTLGLTLVVGLVEKQLRGELTLDRRQGACFTIHVGPDRV
jgi:two-component sensor histidine kinase